MAYKVGLEGVLYRNTGTFGTPVWDEIPNVDDLELTLESDEADVSNRASGGFETIIPGLHKVAIDFGMIYDPEDEDQTAMREDHLSRTIREYAVADGPIASAGTQYLRAHCYITSFGRSEKLREGMKTPVKLKPGFVDVAENPAWETSS